MALESVQPPPGSLSGQQVLVTTRFCARTRRDPGTRERQPNLIDDLREHTVSAVGNRYHMAGKSFSLRFDKDETMASDSTDGCTPRVAVYTGSFDPITLGHLNVIQRSSTLVDKLIVGVGMNVEKTSMFTLDERVNLIAQVTSVFGNVEVRPFAGLAVTFVRECEARVMIRGVRPLTDIAGEFTMMMANRQLDPDIETVFLMADEEFAHVSSSLIKQLTPLSSDEMLAKFVPSAVIPALRNKLKKE